MSSSTALREISTVARPLIEQWLDVSEQMAALREVATAKGLDWSQLKALLKAQIQDERDDSGEGKRVARVVEKAEFACAYADMLGFITENIYSAQSELEASEEVRRAGLLNGSLGKSGGRAASHDRREANESPVTPIHLASADSSPGARMAKAPSRALPRDGAPLHEAMA